MATFPRRITHICSAIPPSQLLCTTRRRQQLQTIQSLLRPLSKQPSLSLRQFSTTHFHLSRTKPKLSSSPARTIADTYLPSHSSYAATLASRNSPTLLYLAPSDNTYQLACYLVGGFCAAYGCFHFWDVVITEHPGLPAVVSYLTGSVSVIMLLLGGWMILGARRLVGSINAIPKVTSGGRSTGLTLRLEARRFFPVFGKAKVIECTPEDMQLAQKLQHARFASENDPYPMAGKRPKSARERRVEAERKERERKQYELDHVYSAPIRHSWAALKGLRRGLGRIVRRDGFVQVGVAGKGSWRMDVKNGWCMDEGAALDRLLKSR